MTGSMAAADTDAGAKVDNRTAGAMGNGRFTQSSAVQDENMTGLRPTFFRKQSAEILLNAHRVAFPGPAEATGETLDVGIDHHPRGSENVAENDVGGLASDSGQGDQLLHALRHFAGMAFNQGPGAADEVFRLVAEKPGGANKILKFDGVGGSQGRSVGITAEKVGGHLIDPEIGTLRRKDGSDKQLQGRLKVQRALGVGIEGFEAFQKKQGTAAAHSSRSLFFNSLIHKCV